MTVNEHRPSSSSMNLSGTLASMAGLICPFWYIDGTYASAAWPVLCGTSSEAHIRLNKETGAVLDLNTGEHHIPYNAADRSGTHYVPYGQNADGSRKPYPVDGGVALLAITGPMTKEGPYSLEEGTSTVYARRLIRAARSDQDVKATLIRFDTPGGSVAGCDDLAADIARAAQEKPVFGYAEDLCASAGMYAISQCNAVYANPSARVGSIATVLPLVESAGMFEMLGLKSKMVTPADAPYKGAFFPGTEITDEQMAYAQQMVDDYARQFRKSVQKARGLTDDQMAIAGDGRCFSAVEARRMGLIDGVTSYDNVLAKLKTYKPA